jgi:hypothetical protein
MIEEARRLVPAPTCGTRMEELPFEDAAFDVVTGFNAFQFARDPVVATRRGPAGRPAGRSCRGLQVGPPEDNELPRVMGAVRKLLPGGVAGGRRRARAGSARCAGPGGGLDPMSTGDVDVPFEAPDLEVLEAALLAPGAVAR